MMLSGIWALLVSLFPNQVSGLREVVRFRIDIFLSCRYSFHVSPVVVMYDLFYYFKGWIPRAATGGISLFKKKPLPKRCSEEAFS
jgi:hypothetical protein